MKDEFFVKLIDTAENGGGLRLDEDLLTRVVNFSKSEVFRIGRIRSGGEAGNEYSYYRTIDPRGNYKIEHLDMNGLNGKGELELLSIHFKGICDWVYLGSFIISKKAHQVVGHGGLNDGEMMALIKKTVSAMAEKAPVPAPLNGDRSLLQQISRTRQQC